MAGDYTTPWDHLVSAIEEGRQADDPSWKIASSVLGIVQREIYATSPSLEKEKEDLREKVADAVSRTLWGMEIPSVEESRRLGHTAARLTAYKVADAVLALPAFVIAQQEKVMRQAFYRLTVAQRDQAWREIESLRARVVPTPEEEERWALLREEVRRRAKEKYDDELDRKLVQILWAVKEEDMEVITRGGAADRIHALFAARTSKQEKDDG